MKYNTLPTAKEYFEKEYGENHILTVMEMRDEESMYGLIYEYGLHCASLTAKAVKNIYESKLETDSQP